ncbi:MAG: glycosyl transferase [Crocinitomicaceae bacterium TMED16]|nr:MAG: glycosyl transferase [Crocinitomicaceae bacterium TMED16]|tara:strand:+ start:354 stop:1112 length:759 start_codon:yes stop_codon:yes gene_type:complete
MPNLSVVIITFNEEKNIARCLASIETIADDIVVVDSFSTDRTEQICLQFKVRFIQHRFEGHIQQKNWALQQAKYPHVLSLDADEALDEKLKSQVNSIKENWTADGYTMNRLTNYCGQWIKHCGWYPDKKLRLWDTRLGDWGGTNPHDKVIMQKGTRITHLNHDILHYSFYTIDQHLKQIDFFTDISAKAAFDAGERSSSFKIIYKSAFKFFRDYILKLGFLDGYYGFIVCKNSAFAKRMKYRKLQELNKSGA